MLCCSFPSITRGVRSPKAWGILTQRSQSVKRSDKQTAREKAIAYFGVYYI